MSAARRVAPGATATAAGTLAHELTRALLPGAAPFDLRACLDGRVDPVRALGAVRRAGADLLTPHLLAGHPLRPADVALIRAGATAFPAPAPGRPDSALWSLRDAALTQVLAVLGVRTAAWEGLAGAREAAEPSFTWPARGDWSAWAETLAPLAMAALPPVRGPVRDQVARHRDAALRGLTHTARAGDHRTAARLARWLALDADPDSPLRTTVERIAAAASEPRALFEITVARLLLDGGAR
ncbi:hypothetical protein [Streptomyces sp. RFCAC02]|uniref:hypothetical protein n=1 Tax=Streptomyces sp. RFCAC02 TaxID=2499143 RepID=UPI00101FA310|nr:hypothetical protein [Streptomyces sp. RFCAC02]